MRCGGYIRGMFRILTLLSLELLVVAGLWRSGAILDPSNPLDSVVAALRLVALGAMLRLTYSTVVSLTATRLGLTNPGRSANRALAVAVLSSTAAAPAFAATPVIVSDASGTLIPQGALLGPSPSTDPVRDGSRTPPAGEASAVVRRGDNLWRISERHLRTLASAPSPREVAVYWARVVEANRHTLRSGNPDLIYPDETVLLPTP
jgi:hypothetical protein